MSIGERLRYLRESIGLSQGDLAKTLNIARTTYSGYENDIREPDFQFIIKVADFYNVTLDYLFGRQLKEEQIVAPKKEEISLRLKKSRELKGLSQREVSKLSGINNKTISGYENNVSEPDLLTISKLASIYGVSTDWIINGLHFKIEGSNGVLEEELEHSRELLLKFKELAEQIKVWFYQEREREYVFRRYR